MVAIFGPTGVGKTGVSVELGLRIREAGSRAVAVNCDSIQVYRGLEVISGAPSPRERELLDHRMVSEVSVDTRYSSGLYARQAHEVIDSCLAAGIWPLVTGGTGLYLRAALSDLKLLPEVPEAVRDRLERERDVLGAEALHARLPEPLREKVHPNDGKRVLRYLGLLESGVEPHPDTVGGGRLWSEPLRHPTLLVGITEDRDRLKERIIQRVEAMVESGAIDEARAATEAGVSSTAAKAIGFQEFLEGDVAAVERAQLGFARRQMTWMRKMEGTVEIARKGRSDTEVAAEILTMIRSRRGLNASGSPPG